MVRESRRNPVWAWAATAGFACAAQGLADRQPVDPATLSGRDFGALRLASGVRPGDLRFAAAHVTTWIEPAPGAPVTRMLLTGDARVTLGLHDFTASRALVWLAPLPPGDPDAAPGVYQVFVYFDRVATPTADAAVAVTADRLAVQGVFRTTQPVSLHADATSQGRPEDRFVREGERELAVFLRRQITGEPEPVTLPAPAAPAPRTTTPLRPGVSRPFEPTFEEQTAAEVAAAQQGLLPADRNEPVFARDGLLTVASGEIRAAAGQEENTLLVTGGVTVLYWDRPRDRTVQITAERAVLFLEPGPIAEAAQFEMSQVRGVYLEGDVIADDGRYRIRAPRFYYAIRENRAFIVDAVLATHVGRGEGVPLYIRAKSIEQEARDRWTVKDATLTNTAFFDPLLTLGVTSVTVERQPDPAGGERTLVDARNMTLEVEDVPIFWFPRFTGDPAAIPIKGLGFGNSSRTGGVLTTTWDAYGLLGLDPFKGVSADLLVDAYFERGLGIGLASDWKLQDSSGSLFLYALPDDTGEDLTSSGARLEHDGEFRGLALGEHTARLSDDWTLQLQGAYISDPTFVDAMFNELARSRREFENSVYLKRQDDNTVLTAEASGTFNDFTANQYLLQTPGYTVQRVPEVSYTRLADDLFPALAPGVVTYTSEYRLGRLSLNFTDPTAAEMGFTRPVTSQNAFGIDPDGSIAQTLRAAGYSEGWVARFDTRHEISASLAAGPVNVTPFVVGRLTAWDQDFSGFSAEADQRERLWGAAGLRLATEVHRVDNAVESRLFDLHRIRHIVTPSLTLWTSGATIDHQHLPVYDENVESLAEGGAVRIALDQLWQTQRGGPGRWRSVDAFALNTEVVLSSDDTDPDGPIGRFFEARPELSNLGNFATIDATWQVSEAVALGANTIYDLDASQQARTSLGAMVQHHPGFTTYGELRYINSQDQTYVNFGAQYELTDKYDFSGSVTYDTDRADIQFISAQLRREFPNVTLGLAATYNDVTGETSFGFLFQPLGMGRGPNPAFQTAGGSRGRIIE